MAVALAVMAGASLLGGLAQYYSAEKARKASQARLNKIEEMFNKIKPPDYDLSITDPPALHQEKLALPQFSDPLQAPKFDLSKLDPEDLKVVGKFNPELPALVMEAEPELIKKTEGMKLGREAQLKALKRLQGIGEGEFDPEYQQQVQEAARAAQGEAQSRQASIMQDFARRGIAGSGMNLAAQIGASASSMDRAAQANQAAAAQAYRNRLNALMSGAQLGSQIRGEDIDLQARNTAAINAFNQRVSRQRQAYEDQRAQAMNQAQMYNLGVGQSVEQQNVAARNQAAMADRARLDALAKYGAGFAQQEAARADRNVQQQYANQVAQQQYANQMAAGQAAWKAGELEKQNKLKQQMYQDQMGRTQGAAGIAGQQSAADISAAKDRGALIQGLTNVAMTGALAANQQQQQDRQAFNQANTAFMTQTGQFMDPAQKEAWQKSYEDY